MHGYESSNGEGEEWAATGENGDRSWFGSETGWSPKYARGEEESMGGGGAGGGVQPMRIGDAREVGSEREEEENDAVREA